MAKILFVDDEEQAMRWHRIMLEETGGHPVAFFRFAERAMQYIEKTKQDNELPDAIILDVNMPADGRYANDPTNEDGMRTGIRLLRDICQLLGTAIPPVIIYTQLQNPDIPRQVKVLHKDAVVLDKLAAGPEALLDKVNILLGQG